ncbi:hypothetical protein RAS1_22270 [Phycisphaerae bacterium RAS1]|nr:hypothetical protein RAS1_22270 [Phycisphaerae bacterium RAS1]
MKPAWLTLLILVSALAIWGLTDIRRRARIDPARPDVHKTDLTVYTGAAREIVEGRDPYAITNPRGMYYLYPPLFALLLTPLTTVDTQTQAVTWFAVNCLLAAGCAVEAGKIARAARRGAGRGAQGAGRPEDSSPSAPVWIWVCATLAVLMPALNTLQRGQANIAVLYPLLLGFRLVLTARRNSTAIVGGVLLALPVALKLTPALPVAFVLLQEFVAALRRGAGIAHDSTRAVVTHDMVGTAHPTTSASCTQHAASSTPLAVLNPRHAAQFLFTTLGVALGLSLFFFLIPAACTGWHRNLELLRTWKARVAANENVGVQNAFNDRSYRNQSLENAAYHCGNFLVYSLFGGPDDRLAARRATTQAVMPMDSPWFDAIVNIVRGGLLLLLFIAGLSGFASRDPLRRAAAFGLACLLTLLVSPLSWAHHYVIAFPAAVFVPLWLLRTGRFRAAVLIAGALASLSVAHYALLEHVGRVGMLGLGTAVVALVASWSLAFPRPKLLADGAGRAVFPNPPRQAAG